MTKGKIDIKGQIEKHSRAVMLTYYKNGKHYNHVFNNSAIYASDNALIIHPVKMIDGEIHDN